VTKTRQNRGTDKRGAARGDRPVRFEGLEAYRGIAALSVVVFHAYQYSREGLQLDRFVYEGSKWHTLFHNLDGAVSWFFVLSGFLVFLPFSYAAVRHGRRRSARSFLIRRALRILPLYYVAILVVWGLRYTGSREEWVSLLQHLTFTHVFSQENLFRIIGPAWSLADEVIFYLMVAGLGPLVYLACRHLNAQGKRAALIGASVTALALFSVGYKWWAYYAARIPEENYPVYFGPLAHLDSFALGMLLAVILAAGWLRFGKLTSALLYLGGVAFLAMSFTLRDTHAAVDLYFYTLCAVAFAMVLAATVVPLAQEDGRAALLSWLLGSPVLVYVGLISYSIYMWHEPILLELGSRGFLMDKDPQFFPQNALVLVVVSIAVAAVSYSLIERPAMRLYQFFDWKHPKQDTQEEGAGCKSV
jgi:peptidoglycan/LPS O-acetylase OafA/YrhL